MTVAVPAPNILDSYSARIKTALASVSVDDYVGMRQNLALLKQLLLGLVKELLDHVSAEQMRVMAAAPLPPDLELPKLALYGAASPEEQAFLDSVAAMYQEGAQSPDFASRFLLARLLLLPYRVDHVRDWHEVPAPYFRNFIQFQFETLSAMQAGDNKRCCHHLRRVLQSLLHFINTPGVPEEQRLIALDAFVGKFNASNLMMSDENALPIMKLRFEILKHIAQTHMRSDTDWTPPPRDPAQKIRLGICVATLMTGSETLAMLATIGALDRSKYEIIFFFFNLDMKYSCDINYLRELLNCVDELVALPMENAAKCIDIFRQRNLDLLWHQSHIGLAQANHPVTMTFIHRLARRQCFSLVMHAFTSGNPYFQYVINLSPPVPPKTWAGEFSETELNVPGIPIYVPDVWHEEANRIVTRESLSIPMDAIIYCAGAAAEKHNAETVMAWVSILKENSKAYLVLYPFNPSWYPRSDSIIAFYARLHYAYTTLGVDSDRIKVLGHVNGEAIAQMLRWGHVFLASFPYGGVTTLSDALRGGLCPVCRRGQSSRANGDASILAAYGLDDLITTSAEDYVNLAVRLGVDAEYRASVKARVHEAWQTRRAGFASHIALTHAAVIDEIAERESGFVDSPDSGMETTGARRVSMGL